MVPFLAQSREEIIRTFASRFIIKDVLDKANTCIHLIKMNFKEASQHKRPENVDIGIATKLELNDLKKKGKVTETQILRFKSLIISFFVYIVCTCS